MVPKMSKLSANVTEEHGHPIVNHQVEKKDWRRYIWDSLDKSPEERHFIFKLDLTLLTFGCLGFFIKFLDQANLVNAFVSGMKEDLGMFGNQLNYATTAYTVGYILGEIPSNVILTRVRPSIWLPTLEVIWAVLTFCLASCKNTTQLYVLRFLIGLAEAGFYPGLNYMIGSWYRKDEIAKRSGILNASGSIASIFSGFLMSAVVHLGGKGGLPGWKWLFIVDGAISLPIAFASFYFLPDSPETNRGFFFSEDEIKLAKKRMILEGRQLRKPYTAAKIKRILTSWHIWLFSLLYATLAATQGTPVFPQYLKYAKVGRKPRYNLTQINNYPSFMFGVAVIATVVYAWASDSFLGGRRWPVMLFGGVFQCITCISLAVWDISEGWRWACYILAGQVIGLSGISNSWANEVCSDDNEERAIVLATMNMMSNVLAAWLPLLVWKQVEAPKYHKGFTTASCKSVLFVFVIAAISVLQRRELRRKTETLEEGSVSEVPVVESKEASEIDLK